MATQNSNIMEHKKNPKKDINSRSGVYFAFGLVLVLLLAFVALEWKTYDTKYDPDIGMNTLDEVIYEDAPIFVLENLPPPPPPIVPTDIEIVENEDPVEETIIETSETNQDTEIITNGDIILIEHETEPEVNWISIEEVPVFPGCENEQDKRSLF